MIDLATILPLVMPAFGLAAPTPGESVTVNIDIPGDHPKAPAFLRMVAALRTSTRLPSGLEVKGLERPGAVEEFFDALREIDPGAVEFAKERLGIGVKKAGLDQDKLIQLTRLTRAVVKGE
jgi:hypothetical protein